MQTSGFSGLGLRPAKGIGSAGSEVDKRSAGVYFQSDQREIVHVYLDLDCWISVKVLQMYFHMNVHGVLYHQFFLGGRAGIVLLKGRF